MEVAYNFLKDIVKIKTKQKGSSWMWLIFDWKVSVFGLDCVREEEFRQSALCGQQQAADNIVMMDKSAHSLEVGAALFLHLNNHHIYRSYWATATDDKLAV
eukprot:scpid68656/ scgid32226/ 